MSSIRIAIFALAVGFAVGTGPITWAQTVNSGSGFQGIWYENKGGMSSAAEALYHNKYGGGMATYPQQHAPMAVYSAEANKTFFTFNYNVSTTGGQRVGHAISYYDHETGLVARPQIWQDKGTSDAHDTVVLSIDDAGYLYMFSMTHGETRRSFIRRSANPYDISSTPDGLLSLNNDADKGVFGALPGDSANTVRFSYASAWHVSNAAADEKFLMLYTRYQNDNGTGAGGNRDLFTTTSVDADVWTSARGIAQIEQGQYQTSWIKPDKASVGTIFNVHPSGVTGTPLNARTDLYYMETHDQGGTWQTIDGVTLVDNRTESNPLLSRPDNPALHGAALVYDAAPGERVYLKDVNYDAAGNPIVLFLTASTHDPGPLPDDTDRTVHTAYWKDGSWNINQVTTTDHNYDYGMLNVDSEGNWNILAPFIDGPQVWGTGGEIGMWTSSDEGNTWTLKQLTTGSEYNHSYVQRAVDAHDDFYGYWSYADAFDPSEVHIYFANSNGDVYRLPFEMEGDFAVPELVFTGDYNRDGIVDAADYTIWRNTLGSTTQLQADGNANGIIDEGDYLVWKTTFGRTTPWGASAGAVVSAVPEPGTTGLVALGLLVLMGVRRAGRVA